MIWEGYRQEKHLIDREDAVFYDVTKSPFRLHGQPSGCEGYRRLPPEVVENGCSVGGHYTASAGLRLRFVTDSPYMGIRVKHRKFVGSPNSSRIACLGFDIYVRRKGDKQIYCGSTFPSLDVDEGYEAINNLPEGEKEVTLYFPISTEVYSVELALKKNCVLKEAPDYAISKPVLFYGSSITHGGCASRPGLIYESFISRDLECDFMNFGFSGNAKGEPQLAEYFATLPMSAFVLDYDHNAPTVEHLKETHEQFYKIIREKNPELPIILVSKPDTSIVGAEHQRRTIIMETFLNARNAGDDNIYFIDGYSFFPEDIRKDCTVDGCHPNDMGMYYMAKSIGGMLKEIFKMKNSQINIEHIDF